MRWNSDEYNRHAGFVSRLGEDLLALLAPMPGELILDLGCGDGTLAEKIAEKKAVVQGVDSSADMVQAARDKGVNAFVLDADEMGFDDAFDAVFSNAALHWMKKDPGGVVKKVFRALHAGGRFCAEFGACGNVLTITTAIRQALAAAGLRYENYNPWYFPEAGEYRKHLEAAGFNVAVMEVFERPTALPTDLCGWLKVFALPFLRDIAADKQEDFIYRIAQSLEGQLKKEDGLWYADYVRCRFLAVKAAR